MTATATPPVGVRPGRLRPGRAVGLVAQAIVLVVGVALSAQFCLAAVHALGLAWPVTHPEGATIAAVLRVRDGEPLYQDFRQPPYLVTPYPPLQPVVVGLTSRLLGLPLLEMIALGRSLTLASSVATAALIWALTRAYGAGSLAALAGASLFLPLPFVDEWGYAVRPDLPAVALSLLAMLVLALRPDRPWIAAGIAVLAFFTKQTAIALPIAATLWLLLGGRWRGALQFAGAWVGLAVLGIGLLEAWTGGRYLLNTVLAHWYTPKNGFDLAGRDLLPLFAEGWLPVGLASIAMIVLVARRRRSAPALLPVLYALVTTAATLVTLRTVGSDVNYLIEPAAAACILAGLAIDCLWARAVPRLSRAAGEGAVGIQGPHGRVDGGRGPRAWERGPVGGSAAVALTVAMLVWGYEQWGYWQVDGGVHPTARLPLQEIANANTVLSEEPLAVLLAGKPLFVSDTFHFSMLATAGFFDPLDLERRIKRSEFDLIVTRADISAPRYWKRQAVFPESLRVAIKDVYTPAGRVGTLWLWRPERRRAER